MKKQIIFYLSLLASLSTFAQSPDWIAPFGSNQFDEVRDLQVFGQDSFIAVGQFEGASINFGSITINNSQTPDQASFIVKGDLNGNYVWAHAIEGNSGLPSVEIDNNGNFYVAGSFQGTINLQPGGSDTLQANPNNFNGEIFVAKYSPSGNLLWKQKIKSSSVDLNDISYDGSNNLYITGSIRDIAYTRSNADTIGFSSGRSGILLASIDPSNGSLIRGNAFYVDTMSFGSANGVGLASDGGGNVYMIGRTSDTVDINPNTGTRVFANSQNERGFVARYSSSGSLTWSHTFDATGTPVNDPGSAVYNIERFDSHIYVEGLVEGQSGNSYNYTFGSKSGAIPGTLNTFLCKIGIGSGTVDKVQFFERAFDIRALNFWNDTLIISGGLEDSADFDPGPGAALYNFDVNYDNDAFVALYDTGFAYQSHFVFGDSALNGPDAVSTIDFDAQGRLILGGIYGNAQTDFQPGVGTNATGVFVGGGTDAFVARYSLSSAPSCDIDSAGPISGRVNVCQFDEALVYTIDTVGNSNATNFTWTFTNGPQPINFTGQGTRSISIDITNDPFTINVTPSNATCSGASSSLAINNPNLPPALADTVRQRPNCGQSNGAIDIEITNASPAPYRYIWSNGDTLDSLIALPSGSYTVSVTDAFGCSAEKTIALNDLGAPQIDSTDITAATCFGSYTGALDIHVSGGAVPYTYFWSNGDTVEDPQNLGAGGYRVTIKDSTGCSYTEILIVGQPNAISSSLNITNASTCGAADASVNATVFGGVQPYSLNWSNGSNGNAVSALSAGSYVLTITDNNACELIEQLAITEDGAPVIGLDSIGNESCLDTNGYVHTNVTGASGSASYLWSSGESSLMISDVAAGIYTLSVTDGACTALRQFEVEKIAPEAFPICLATVDDSTRRNIIVWEKPHKSTLSSFEIYRESWQDDAFLRIADSHVDTLSQYIDFVAEPKLKSWSYKMITTDVCGAKSEFSAEHTTIHLVMQRDTSGPIDLNWNAYRGFQYDKYYIERLTDTATGWVLIDSVSVPLTTYRDLNAPKQTDLLYAIGVNHPTGGCQTSRAAPKKYGSVRSNRSINAGDNPTIDMPIDNTGLSSIEVEKWNMLIYPNPSSSSVWIKMDGPLEVTKLELMDISGRMVLQQDLNSEMQQIDIKHLKAGVYLVNLSRGEEHLVQRLIIQ